MPVVPIIHAGYHSPHAISSSETTSMGSVLAGIGWEITSKLARPRIQLADLLTGGILLQFLAFYIFYGIL
jgi:hypothetical protein